MSDYIERYEKELFAAASSYLTAARRRRRRRAVALVGAVAAIVAAVPAAAGTDWLPFGGRSDAPSTSSSPPDADLTNMLGVLRRPQRNKDRGPESRYALHFQGNKTYADVRLPYVRFAAVGPGDRGVVLIPAGSHRRAPDAVAQTEVVCTFRVSYFEGKPEGGAPGCWQADDIRDGRAIHQIDRRVDMLVPDGVARVDGTTQSGRADTATPHDNVASWVGRLPARVLWYDEYGAQIRRIDY